MFGQYISRLEAGDRVPSLQLLRKLALKLDADEQYLATGVEQVQQPPPELIEAEVERRLSGWRPNRARTTRGRRTGSRSASRARVLWAHSRQLAARGERSRAAAYPRDAPALLDYADDLSASA